MDVRVIRVERSTPTRGKSNIWGVADYALRRWETGWFFGWERGVAPGVGSGEARRTPKNLFPEGLTFEAVKPPLSCPVPPPRRVGLRPISFSESPTGGGCPTGLGLGKRMLAVNPFDVVVKEEHQIHQDQPAASKQLTGQPHTAGLSHQTGHPGPVSRWEP